VYSYRKHSQRKNNKSEFIQTQTTAVLMPNRHGLKVCLLVGLAKREDQRFCYPLTVGLKGL